jgi:hypothetical protein
VIEFIASKDMEASPPLSLREVGLLAPGGRAKHSVETTLPAMESKFKEGFKLKKVYPNPFVETATMKVWIKKKNRISINIYDSIGRRVKKLGNIVGSGKVHKVNIDGKNMSSGLYVLLISDKKKSESTKIIISK